MFTDLSVAYQRLEAYADLSRLTLEFCNLNAFSVDIPSLRHLSLLENPDLTSFPTLPSSDDIATLDLSFNHLTGLFPLTDYPALVDLKVVHNGLTGVSVPVFPNPQPSNLEVLRLSYNAIDSTAFAMLNSLPRLSLLEVDHNDLTLRLLEVRLPSLRRLDLSVNRIAGVNFSGFSNNLRDLDLGTNRLLEVSDLPLG